jgi:hypothetical protein
MIKSSHHSRLILQQRRPLPSFPSRSGSPTITDSHSEALLTVEDHAGCCTCEKLTDRYRRACFADLAVCNIPQQLLTDSMRCNMGGSTYKKWDRGVAVTTHTVSYESTHSCYLTSSPSIPSISIPIRHGKCTAKKKIAQLFHHSATTVVLDDVCVDGNMSNYYNVLRLVEQ